MEGKGECQHRRVRRCFEMHRLEEELWALAYEHLWPQLRRAVPKDRGVTEGSSRTPIQKTTNIARRA